MLCGKDRWADDFGLAYGRRRRGFAARATQPELIWQIGNGTLTRAEIMNWKLPYSRNWLGLLGWTADRIVRLGEMALPTDRRQPGADFITRTPITAKDFSRLMLPMWRSDPAGLQARRRDSQGIVDGYGLAYERDGAYFPVMTRACSRFDHPLKP